MSQNALFLAGSQPGTGLPRHCRHFSLINRDELVSLELYHLEDAVGLLLGQRSLVRQLALHLVSSVLSTGDLSRSVQDGAFTLTAIVGPFSVVDGLIRGAEITTPTRPLSVDEISNVEVTRLCVLHAAGYVLLVGLPGSLVDRAVEVDHLANSLLHELLMLPKVDVTIWKEELAD